MPRASAARERLPPAASSAARILRFSACASDSVGIGSGETRAAVSAPSRMFAGTSCTVRSSPRERTTIFSTVLRSSRTFPGHG